MEIAYPAAPSRELNEEIQMKKVALAVFCSMLALTVGAPPQAFAQLEQPDLDLAYVLATASYCAYAVGEADADSGRKQALQCLTAAAASDHSRLELFEKIAEDDVEAFFNPGTPEDAYLLIRRQNSVMLAFRGTLTPPISPASGRFPSAVGEAIAKYHEREAALLKTFIADRRNNFRAKADARQRHQGFAAAWSGLESHLIGRDCPPGTSTAGGGCSKFLSFIAGLPGATPPKLYITGHSKGGALATLAGLDLPGVVGAAIAPVVYTFAGAKSLTTEGAKAAAAAAPGSWRFEHEWDIVPSVPPDSTVPAIAVPSYAHVGGRLLFAKGKTPERSTGPTDGVDPPGDMDRLKAATAHVFESALSSFPPSGPAGFFEKLRGTADAFLGLGACLCNRVLLDGC
jgi:Lipase (class 3)